jgi:hypothetical protein
MHSTQNLYELLLHPVTAHVQHNTVVNLGEAKISYADLDPCAAEIDSGTRELGATSVRVVWVVIWRDWRRE